MKQLATFTIADIRKWKPCYDPIKYIPEDWTGTAIDLLQRTEIPFEDVLWVIARTEILSERLTRLFAVWCARQVARLVLDNERDKFDSVLDVAERYANKEATDTELSAAWGAARGAAWGAARGAAWGAARGATWDAARGATWDAARGAQRDKLIEMILAEARGE